MRHLNSLMRATGFTTISAGLLAAGVVTFSASAANADPATRGLQGAIGGAIVGGVVKGKKGILPGAAIGGAIGIVGGAIEEENRRKRRYRRVRRRKAYQRARTAPQRTYRPAVSELVAGTQQSLLTLGYDPGPVDGVMGQQTSAAIQEYQNNYGLPVTGAPSDDLLGHMRQQGG